MRVRVRVRCGHGIAHVLRDHARRRCRQRERFEGARETLRRREAVRRVEGERTRQSCVELVRNVGAKRGQRRHRAREHALHRRRVGGLVEQAAACAELPEHDGERVDIGATRGRLTLIDLRRDVAELALDLAGGGDTSAARVALEDAEVGELREAVDADDHVLRRHITMNDAQKAAVVGAQLVRGVQTGERVLGDAQRDRDGHRTVGTRRRLHEPGDRQALDVLHDDHHRAVAERDVERRDHIGMTDQRSDARFLEHHLRPVARFEEMRMTRLDGDRPLEAERRDASPEVHGRHAAGRDLANDLVALLGRPRECGECAQRGALAVRTTRVHRVVFTKCGDDDKQRSALFQADRSELR